MKTFQLSKVINSYGSVETNMLFQHVKQLEAMDMVYTSQLEQTYIKGYCQKKCMPLAQSQKKLGVL